MEIVDFLYIGSRPGRGGSLRFCAVLLLAVTAWSCAGTQRQAAVAPQSVPARPISAAREEPAGDEEPTQVGGVHHVVQPGQTLWRIARTYGLPLEQLAQANEIEDPTQVAAGTLLFIPGARRMLEVPAFPTSPGGPAGPEERSPEVLTGRTADWVWPVEQARILSYFGAPRSGHRHGGIDIGGRHGEPVLASRSGRVVYSGAGMRGYGKTVILDHGDGLRSLYAHNAKLLVRIGQQVDQGMPVALIGRTGNATAEHCHFEIRRNDKPLDPLLFLLPPLEAQR